MLIKKTPAIRASEITDEREYRAASGRAARRTGSGEAGCRSTLNRREFVRAASGAALAAAAAAAPGLPGRATHAQEPLAPLAPSRYGAGEKWNSFQDITSYNNFYEFGTDKEDPARHAGQLQTTPWTVRVEGHIGTPEADHALEDILRPHPLEERVYRLRCVEAWSMVVPWVGFPLGDLIKRFEPTSRARFVRFETLLRPSEMPGQRRPILQWPYVEALRMDEAMHPLTILAVGLYGKTLLNQNGAPLRLVVPWKYGFKSIKSIVKIQFVENQPRTSWNVSAPSEYGFWANVNPHVDHPRWSQRNERRIGRFFRQETRMFNGYGDQVAQLYAGMDLRRNY